jgi:hypothetical protein
VETVSRVERQENNVRNKRFQNDIVLQLTPYKANLFLYNHRVEDVKLVSVTKVSEVLQTDITLKAVNKRHIDVI